MTTRVWGEAYRTNIVCVDTYQRGILHGRFYNHSLKAGKTFHCLTQLLQEMENTLNKMDFPKAYTAARSFAPVTPATAEDTCEEDPVGKQATFAVRILFRQNASWQGSVVWMEEGREESFRSALELIFLMDSALSQTTELHKRIV